MIQSPRKFLCEFLLAGALLLVGWTYISDLYLELLLGGVNLGLWFTNASIFLRSGEPIGQGRMSLRRRPSLQRVPVVLCAGVWVVPRSQ